MNLTQELYPASLLLERADFLKCDWRAVLADLDRDGYSSMGIAFSNAASRAVEGKDQKNAKIFWLFADACSMRLRPHSNSEPFRKGFFSGVVPDNLLAADIEFFSGIVDDVEEPWLRARLADLVWLKSEARNSKFALMAIDAYRQVPLDLDTWLRDGEHCWHRAIGLAKKLRNSAGDRLTQMEAEVVAAIKEASFDDGFLPFWLSKLLAEFRLGYASSSELAKKLGEIALAFQGVGDFFKAREYFNASGHWFRVAKDDEQTAKMFIQVAENFAKEAYSKETATTPISALVASLYEDAIQAYRRVPHALRSALGVEKRIAELRALLKNAGELAIGQFQPIESSVDISECIEHAREAVSGKSSTEVLSCFTALYAGANAARLRKQTINARKRYVFSNLFRGSTQFGKDGRVIAKRAANGTDDAGATDETIVVDMVRDFQTEVGLVVQGYILPALDVMHVEHQLSERYFIEVAHRSPIVPPRRALLFGRGLFAGYDHDFAVSVHLLTPQIEHLVRFHLNRAGVLTTKLDATGVETELGLSALIDLPDAKRVLGENLTFEIRAVFCDAFGPNLRNEIAHGLLDDRECQSIYSVYAWWFALRLVFGHYWKAHHADASN